MFLKKQPPPIKTKPITISWREKKDVRIGKWVLQAYAPVLFGRPSSSRFLLIIPPLSYPSVPRDMYRLLFCISLSISLEHTPYELLPLKLKRQEEVRLNSEGTLWEKRRFNKRWYVCQLLRWIHRSDTWLGCFSKYSFPKNKTNENIKIIKKTWTYIFCIIEHVNSWWSKGWTGNHRWWRWICGIPKANWSHLLLSNWVWTIHKKSLIW